MALTNNVIPELAEIYFQINGSIKQKVIYPEIVVPSKIRSGIFEHSNDYVAGEISNQVHALLSKEKRENRSDETELLFDLLRNP